MDTWRPQCGLWEHVISIFHFLLTFYWPKAHRENNLQMNQWWKKRCDLQPGPECQLCFKIAETFLKTLGIIVMISLNKQYFNCIHSQVWHCDEHQAGLLCCVWDQNDRFAVTENKRAPQKCGKPSQHTKLFSRQNGKSCRPRTAWADVGTSAAQTAPVCFLISSQRGLTASKQALPIKHWMTAWLWASPSLSSTFFLATGSARKWILSS